LRQKNTLALDNFGFGYQAYLYFNFTGQYSFYFSSFHQCERLPIVRFSIYDFFKKEIKKSCALIFLIKEIMICNEAQVNDLFSYICAWFF
jgi:hypothetical protein